MAYGSVNVPGAQGAGTAGAAEKLNTPRKIDGVSFDGSADISHYSTCSTAAATAGKAVTLAGFTLAVGAVVRVKFTATNTAANPTLNVNGTGAKAIYYRGAAIAAGYLAANRTYELVYNGAQYEVVGDIDTNTTYTAAAAAPKAPGTAAVGTSAKYAREDHVHPSQASVSGNAGTATKLATARTIDGVAFDGSAAISHYGTCTTAADVAAKVVAMPGFSLVTGARITVKFTYYTEAENPTLNVNGTGAKAVYSAEGRTGRRELWGEGKMVEFIYDGSKWLMINPPYEEGGGCVASGNSSHAEGWKTTAQGGNSHAEGIQTTASGSNSHAEGIQTTASGSNSHAEGFQTTASWSNSHAEGSNTTASGNSSHAGGTATIASAGAQTTIGAYNVDQPSTDGSPKTINNKAWFIVGKGTSDTARANAFRVGSIGVWATGNYSASGADYAELFEWQDANHDGRDRAGLFVTLDGEKIRLAGPEDDFVLGIVSGDPSIVGDVHDDQWQGMYLYDVFGRPIWEDVEEEDDPADGEPQAVRVDRRQKLNPDYDSSRKYIPRTERPEWDAVGMLGKLVAVDDGTCQVNGWCKPGEGGVATASGERTRYRVMARLDGTHIRVLIL